MAIPDQGFAVVHAIVNPASGDEEAPLDVFEAARARSGATWTLTTTAPDDDPADLARAAVEAGADLVIASGGDGTVSGVAEGLRGTDATLGIVPTGTANVLAAELDIPEDPGEALGLALGSPHRRALDLGQVTCPDGTTRTFILRMGLGLKAKMIVDVEDDTKSRLGRWSYLWTLLQHWFKASPVTYHLTLDGAERTERGVTCIVSNAGVLGLSAFRLAGVQPDDGVLNVVVVRRATVGTLLRTTVGVLASALPGRDFDPGPPDYVDMWPARHVRIEADRGQTIDCDGEGCDFTLPLEVEVVPGAVRVVAPERRDVG